MFRRTFTTAVMLAALLSLTVAPSASAGGPVRQTARPGDLEAIENPGATGSPAPTGLAVCDIVLSTVGGPLYDSGFSVRIYEDFIVWGNGYPADTAITIAFMRADASHTFETTSDAAGQFAEGFFFSPGGPTSWSVEAYPPDFACFDSVGLTLLPPHPFTDVVAFELEISWLHREGITGGCTSSLFCPKTSVTRGQMAAFLNRALSLPATSTDFFDDDDGTLFEGDINRLAASGITGGCGTRRFCPDASVTREQMASFLVRALGLPATSTDFFTDDETSAHESDINRLAAAGITGGCASGRYCPRANVTREQMAAFLYRAFH